jgi:hypothetical protein
MRKSILLLTLLLSAFLTVACERQGPAERVGEQIDEAAEDVGNAVEDACEDAKEAATAEDTDC